MFSRDTVVAMKLKDIALKANVSVATVSRCLNDSSLVSEETRRRVLSIAKETGYEFNASARSLSANQVGTIGVVLPEYYDELKVHLYHSSLHNHLRRTLERADLDLIVAFSHNHFSGINNVEKLVRRKKVDGLIVMLPSLNDQTERFLTEQGVPCVYSHYPPPSRHETRDRVYVDHERGGMLVGEFFARKQCRCVMAFQRSREPEDLEFYQRVQGLKAGLLLGEFRGTITEIEADATFERGFEIATDPSHPIDSADAILALNDFMAYGLIDGLRSRGRRVPQDVMVVGYDDSPLAGIFPPRLTTVKQPAEEVAFLTCERLIKMIEDRYAGRVHNPRQIALRPHLIIRDTAM
ncbi:MAG: LacI family transcriptional regulator [Spirochaetaceae bacterium]|nr:MAG: LacI family transcriptional regulator [Spirochaetaceae bacterium]